VSHLLKKRIFQELNEQRIEVKKINESSSHLLKKAFFQGQNRSVCQKKTKNQQTRKLFVEETSFSRTKWVAVFQKKIIIC
jgi:hypothetical protein